MFSARPLSFALFRLPSSVPLYHASTSSARHFCLFGRNLTRFQAKEPLREQLKNALTKNREAREAPRPDSIPPRPLGQIIIRGGIFFFVTSSIFSTVAALNDLEMTQKQFKTLLDHTIFEFRRMFFFAPPPMEQRKNEADKMIWTIIGANVAVFLLWRVSALSPLMYQYFCSSVVSKSLCMPMLLSVFSHTHFLHLAVNMYVLKSFAFGAISLLGPAQFLSMFLSGGVFASWLSLCQKSVLASKTLSLGASGAICAVMGYVCSKLPDMRVHIIFLPMFNFSAEYALYGLLAFELLCLLRIVPLHRFVQFDNCAHIGGLVFGIYYANHGEQLYRSKITDFYMTWTWSSSQMTGDESISPKKTIIYKQPPKEKRKHEDDNELSNEREQKDWRREIRHKFGEDEAQQKRKKEIKKRHDEWMKQMEEEKEAVKERIRANKQKCVESADEEFDDEDDGKDRKNKR